MDTFEEKYGELISKLSIIEMVKQHKADLLYKVSLLNKDILMLEVSSNEVLAKLEKHQKNKVIKTFVSGLKAKFIKVENSLKKEYLSLVVESKEKNELIDLIEFELKVLDEKLVEESAIRNRLSVLLNLEWENVQDVQSKQMKAVMKKQMHLQKLIQLKVEFDELIAEGENLLKLIGELRDKFRKDLVIEIKIDKLTPAFRTYCSKAIDDIRISAFDLQQILKTFSKEYSDVYHNGEEQIKLTESKNVYFNTLSFGELIIEKLKDKDVSNNVLVLINKMVKKIIELNHIFKSEVSSIRKMIEISEKEFNDLLSEI